MIRKIKKAIAALQRHDAVGWIALPTVLGAILYAQNARLSGGTDQWIQYLTQGVLCVAGLVLLQLGLVRRGLPHWVAAWQSVIIGTASGFAVLSQNGIVVWMLAWIALTARSALPTLGPIFPLLLLIREGDLTVPLLCWAGVLIWNGKRAEWIAAALTLSLAFFLGRFALESPEITLGQWHSTLLYSALGTYGVAGIFALSGYFNTQNLWPAWKGWAFAAIALLAFSQSREWSVLVLLMSAPAVAYWQSRAYLRLADAFRPRTSSVRGVLFVLIALLNGAETAAKIPWDDSALPRYLIAAALLIAAERRART